MSFSRLQTRQLKKYDAAGRALAVAAGLHGIYVVNAIDEGLHDGFVFSLDDQQCGLAWFGPRGNLVLIANDQCLGIEQQIAQQIQLSRWTWRIALGPASIVDLLAKTLHSTPLAHRNQIYYAGSATDANQSLLRKDIRQPNSKDRERLARATLALNASDLNIAPNRVDRKWLYRMVDERIKDGSTRVLGPPGDLWCKLDYGTHGPGGTVIEGVFTFPDYRGTGLGGALVATCMAEESLQLSLHVAEHNQSARSAYERAGMKEAGHCRLLLLD